MIITMANWREIDLLEIEKYDFTPEELAMPVSMINRYIGGLIRPLSVAEHSVKLCDSPQVQEQNLGDAAIIHDLSEGLVGDLINPLKRSSLGDEYLKLETRIQRHLFDIFGVPWYKMSLVDPLDRRICEDEVRQLRPGGRGFGMEPLGVEYSATEDTWLYWYWEMCERFKRHGLTK